MAAKQAIYQEVGWANDDFDTRLREAVDHLLEVEAPDGQVDVDNFHDAAWAGRHDDDFGGEEDGFADRLGDGAAFVRAVDQALLPQRFNRRRMRR